MSMYRRHTAILMAAALLLLALASGLDGVEYRPGEKAAEELFSRGIGTPWVGGEPFKSSTYSQSRYSFSAWPYTGYKLLGYLSVYGGLSIAGDGGASLEFTSAPGSYPVYGYYRGDDLKGIFIDLSSSA
ncbi:MAG: hypothetical protein QUS08_07335 [Methanothrix sp.]|nr:hypothetical protein [Methanothrix sp.]